MANDIRQLASQCPSAKASPFIWFLIANVVLCLFVFRGGLWGGDLLAPLDILPAVASKYRFMDPNSSGIPANHIIIDQVTYDLPLQTTIYRAYRDGEMPWWDPYNWAGRPLLAEAHCNGTEPIRVLAYLTLPFELAYNWARVLNFVFGGLAMLLLLRHWKFSAGVCVPLALAYEFAGSFVLFFGHPWVQAQFNYYPLIWLAWDAWFQKRTWWSVPLATVAAAGVFNAGNLQSHSYLVLFSSAALLGYGARSVHQWKRILPIVALSVGLGAALTAPVLLGELELYARSLRTVVLQSNSTMFGGLATLSVIYPWAMGTFRTLDLAKLLNRNDMGFVVFIGSAAVLLALLGSFRRAARGELAPVRCVGLWLVVIYLLAICTPLFRVFYSRSAGLGVLGLTALAAVGIDLLGAAVEPLRRWGRFAVCCVAVAAISTNIASIFVFPKFIPKVREMVHAHNHRSNTGLQEAEALREFQINNFANEISFKNPETVVASMSILGFAGVCLFPVFRRRFWTMPSLLVLNLIPVVMFAHRFVPAQPIALWQRLTAQGTEQRRVAGILNDGHLRLMEVPRAGSESLYPYALSHLFQVRTVHGYSSLQPNSFILMKPEELQRWLPQAADYIYDTEARDAPAGELKKNPTQGLARFQWAKKADRVIRIDKETLNGIQLSIGPGPGAELLRTDTYYPGWSARIGPEMVPIEEMEPFFSKIRIPAGAQTLALRYEPTHLRTGVALALCALVALAIASCATWYKTRTTAFVKGIDN